MKKRQSLLKVVIYVTVLTGAAAGAGHVAGVPATQPTATCVELLA
jgi:hypothetical protein